MLQPSPYPAAPTVPTAPTAPIEPTAPVKMLGVLPESSSKRILVIEDDSFIMPILSRVLASIDPEIVLDWVTNAADARSALRNGKYQAILADFMLADSDSGLAVYADTEMFQPQARFAMMSALPISVPAGAFGLLSKPFSLKQCRKFMQNLLERSDSRQ